MIITLTRESRVEKVEPKPIFKRSESALGRVLQVSAIVGIGLLDSKALNRETREITVRYLLMKMPDGSQMEFPNHASHEATNHAMAQGFSADLGAISRFTSEKIDRLLFQKR